MKQSASKIFNSSLKTQNNSLNSICSLIKNKHSISEYRNQSLTCLNFPKIYSKLRYTRNKQNILKNSYTSKTSFTRENKKSKLNINSTITIFNYPYKENKTAINTRYIEKNIESNKTNSRLYNFKYHNYSKENNDEYFPEFLFKRKKNNYTKYLSEKYRKNNKKVINMVNIKYKEKKDSILHIIQKDNCFFIKGKKYKKYYFFPHEKMNFLLFHQKLMKENSERCEKRIKIENLKILRNKNIYDQRKSISTNDMLFKREFNQRKEKKHFTKFFYTKNNLKNKLENMVDYEINRATANKTNNINSKI